MERIFLKKLLQRIENEPRRFIQVVYGPRQVGKTTMVRQLLEKTTHPGHYATADAVTTQQLAWIEQQWETARLKCQTAPSRNALLVLDEIQKINNWSEQVKREWDKDSGSQLNLKVILLGSSRLLLQKGLTESLAGRFETMYLPHWSYHEMRTLHGISLNEFIWFGGYPGAASLIRDEERWKSYMQSSIIETSISKDILMLTRVDKPALIRQLFDIGCSYSGQIVSINKIIGQMQDAGNTTTLSQYLTLLDQAGLLAGLPKYSPDIMRQRASIPKFQVHNTALMSAMEPDNIEEVRRNPGRWGRWVESAVGSHLLNQCLTEGYKLFYWRHRNDEVDYIIKGHRKVVALEVKTAVSRSTQGMEAFSRQFNPDRVFLVGPSGLPIAEFMEMEVKDLLD